MEYGIVPNWSGYPFNSQGKLADYSWGDMDSLQQAIEDYALEVKKSLSGEIWEVYMDEYCRYQKVKKIGLFSAFYHWDQSAYDVDSDLPPYLRGGDNVEWEMK